MTRIAVVSLGVFSALVVTISLGCGKEQQAEPSATTAPAQTTSVNEKDSEMNEAFSKLSSADRKLAEDQKICPVSDEPLGSMGTPIKVTVDGRDVFVCCQACVEELKSNFSQYAAKLDQKS